MQAEQISQEAHADSLRDYIDAGVARAEELGNRGPVRYGPDGRLDPQILEAYWQHGFYVFEGLVDGDEIELLRRDYDEILDRAPVAPGSNVDARGRPALGHDFARRPYSLIRPLSDPWGGTELLNGRHPVKMTQPEAAADAPASTPFLIGSMCLLSEAALRLYGHPDILSIAAGVNGDDFTPYNDAVFVKQPRLGGAVAWHQDGVTHWDADNWDEGIHGFNVQVQLYECTPANCLWVMPGTHKDGRIDIKGRVEANGGSEQLPGAVPLLCQPGDITIVNRQMLHCSFANTSPNRRISITFGFHRRSSVVGARGALSQTADEVYDEQRVFDRSAVLQLAINTRSDFYPEQRRYSYAPFVGIEGDFEDTPEVRERVLKDYVLKDLSI